MKYGRRYMITFDLGEKLLQKHYVGDGYGACISSAWSNIARTMKNLGFEHKQQSCYISKGKLSQSDLYNVFAVLIQENTWLCNCFSENCAEPFIVTPVLRQISAKQIFMALSRVNVPIKKEDMKHVSFYTRD